MKFDPGVTDQQSVGSSPNFGIWSRYLTLVPLYFVRKSCVSCASKEFLLLAINLVASKLPVKITWCDK